MTVISIEVGKREEFQNASRKRGATAMNIEEWRQKFEIKRNFKMKQERTGTYGGRVPQQRRPTPDASAEPLQQQSHMDDSTGNSAGRKTISIAKSKRVLIKPGDYFARATKVEELFWHWSWHKWVLKVHFVLAGTEQSVTKFFNCGSDRETPEVSEDTWLGHQLREVADADEVFSGRWFALRIGASRSGEYSVVRLIRRATKDEVNQFETWSAKKRNGGA
jgi:hypothetical protein